MTSRNKRRLLVTLCLTAALLGVALFVLFREKPVQVFTLGNGTKIQYLGRSSGTMHVNPALTLFQRWTHDISQRNTRMAKLVTPGFKYINGLRTNTLFVVPSRFDSDVFWFRLNGMSGHLEMTVRFVDGSGNPLGPRMVMRQQHPSLNAIVLARRDDPYGLAGARRIEVFEGNHPMGVFELGALHIPVGTFELEPVE